jgi:hypothetical protein
MKFQIRRDKDITGGGYRHYSIKLPETFCTIHWYDYRNPKTRQIERRYLWMGRNLRKRLEAILPSPSLDIPDGTPIELDKETIELAKREIH